MWKKELFATGKWHPQYDIKNPDLPYAVASFREMITGCGVIQVKGLSSVATWCAKKEEELTAFESMFAEVCEATKNGGCGTFLATLGDNYSAEKYASFLTRLGFIQIAKYHNYQHGPIYKQRLFIKSI